MKNSKENYQNSQIRRIIALAFKLIQFM